MYEDRRKEPISIQRFRRRVLHHSFWIIIIFAVALGIGTLGYHFIAGLEWVDALLDSSMILSGMGPVSDLHTDAAKLFASFYAVFSGIVFIGVAGLLIAPFAHRLLHHFHWEESDNEGPPAPDS
ncbi:MAG: hypothetical protein M3R13_00010 [Armatimonadota bacterium]|nr:hypothetical protein [Armatimonadota bacterium]